MNAIPGLLLSSQTLVLMVSQFVYRIRFTKGEDEEYGANRKNKIIIGIVIVLALVLLAGILNYVIIRYVMI